MVMQHGVTPAGWEQPTVHLTDVQTGETFDVMATASGVDGHFIATVTVPSSGFWTWTVTLRDLANDPVATSLPVYTADGAAPILDPTSTLAAVDKVRRDVIETTTNTLFTEIARVEARIDEQGAVVDRQAALIKTLEADRAALTAQVAALEEQAATGGGGLPVVAVILLAVLAGAMAGFAMVWLGGRTGPREVAISPGSAAASPRGSTPG
jgi:hypothetical protein